MIPSKYAESWKNNLAVFKPHVLCMKFQCHISLKISRKISNIHTSRENKIMNPYIDHPVSTIITFFFLEGGATGKYLEITG